MDGTHKSIRSRGNCTLDEKTIREDIAQEVFGTLAEDAGQFADWDDIARRAVAAADALLSELRNTQP